MKLYLIHAGFYDEAVSGGFYESHTNYFVVAENVKEAKNKAKEIPEYKAKKMHVDGIKEITSVDGYDILLEESKVNSNGEEKEYSYDDIKAMD